MLLYHVDYLCAGVLLLMLFTMACAGYAYHVNARRAADDVKKRDYPPGAIFLAPFTFPIFIALSISIFIMRVLVYGVFLILFTIALFVIRKPFLLRWLEKTVTYIGNKLLEANTLLIKLFLRPGMDNPPST